MVTPELRLISFALLASGCMGSSRSDPDDSARTRVTAVQESTWAEMRARNIANISFRMPVPAEEAALVLVGPLLDLAPGGPTRVVLRLEALRDSLRPLADSVGVGLYLRDYRHLSFASASRVFGPELSAPDSVGYFFTPWHGIAGFKAPLTGAADLSQELRERHRAHVRAPTPSRAT